MGLEQKQVEFQQLVSGFIYFPVWVEENAAINPATNGGFQWSYGNGATTSNPGGVNIAVDCELFAIGLSAVASVTSAVIAVHQNGVQVADTGTAKSGTSFIETLGSPVSFSAGDILNFQTTGGSGGTSVRAVAWFRIAIGEAFTGPEGPIGPAGADGADGTNFNDQLFGTGVPSNGLGNDGDIYFDNNNGDLYSKVTGAWVFQQNLAGGGATPNPTIEVTNTAQTTVNTNNQDLNSINTTPIFDNSGSEYSIATTGITVLGPGDYEVYFSAFYSTALQRGAPEFEFTINGTAQGPRSASAYMRNQNSHNNANSTLKQTFSLAANDVIGVRFFQGALAGTVTLVAGQSILNVKKVG